MKTCPNCGFQCESTETECLKCGIIFEKWETIEARKKAEREKTNESKEEEDSDRFLKAPLKCQKCGRLVHSTLEKCPFCSDLMSRSLNNKRNRTVWLLAAVIIIILGTILVSSFFEERREEKMPYLADQDVTKYQRNEDLTQSEFVVAAKSSVERGLTVKGNGYDWNAATYEERFHVCKFISRKFGKDYMSWFSYLNNFYDTTNRSILNIEVAAAASMGKVWSDHGTLDW